MSELNPSQANAIDARDSLFMSTDGQPYVSSRAVAERFGKRHTHVLRVIKKLCSALQKPEFSRPNIGSPTNVDSEFGRPTIGPSSCLSEQGKEQPDSEFSRRNIAPRDYLDERGKQQPEYHLSHDGFALVVMSFTGPEALAWKIAFIEAFNALEAELKAKHQLYLDALDQVRPCLRIVAEGTEQGLNRTQIGAQLKKSPAAITYHRGQARKLGLLVARA